MIPSLGPEIENDARTHLSEEWEEITGKIPDLSDDSEVMAPLMTVVLLARNVHRMIEGTYWNGFAEHATGTSLVDRAQDRILERQDATRSRGMLVFSGSPGQQFDADAVIAQSNAGLDYRPLRGFKINDFGVAAVPAESVERGLITRVAADAINTVVEPGGLSVHNQSIEDANAITGPDAGYVTIDRENVANHQVFPVSNVKYAAAVDGFEIKMRNPSSSAARFAVKWTILDDDVGVFVGATSAQEFDMDGGETRSVRWTFEDIDLLVDPAVSNLRIIPLLLERSTHDQLELKAVQASSGPQLRLGNQDTGNALELTIHQRIRGDFLEGTNLESETAFKMRRRQQLYKPGAGTPESIEARLRDLPGMSFVKVEQNDSPHDEPNGLPANSLSPIIYGSTSKQRIADALTTVAHGGIRLWGNIEFVREDFRGRPRKMRWQEAVERRVFVRITGEATREFPPEGEGRRMVQDATITKVGGTDNLAQQHNGLPPGQAVNLGALYAAVKTVRGLSAPLIEIAFEGDPFEAQNLPIEVTEKAITDVDAVRVEIR